MAGGARKGAGRKTGSKDAKPRETAARKVAKQAADAGILPADMMLNIARHLYVEATNEMGEIIDTDKAMIALAAAKEAAPYFNSKLAPTDKDGGAPVVRFVIERADE